MFNENWGALATFAGILGLLTQQPGLLAIAILVLLTAAAGWLWNEYSLRGIQYRRVFSERRAFLGETVELRVEITNRKPLPVAWVKIEDEFPSALAITDGPVRPSTVSSPPSRGRLSLSRTLTQVAPAAKASSSNNSAAPATIAIRFSTRRSMGLTRCAGRPCRSVPGRQGARAPHGLLREGRCG